MSIVYLEKLFNKNNYISQKISILTKLFLCDTLKSQIQYVSYITKKGELMPMIAIKNPYIIEKARHLAIMANDNTWIFILYHKT